MKRVGSKSPEFLFPMKITSVQNQNPIIAQTCLKSKNPFECKKKPTFPPPPFSLLLFIQTFPKFLYYMNPTAFLFPCHRLNPYPELR